jgi:hypothetical protein
MFQEKQYFRQTWLVLLFLGMNLMFVYGIIQQIIFRDPWGNNPAPDGVLIAIWLLLLGLSILFMRMCLHTQIDEVGIWFSFFPLVTNPRQIKWEEVATMEIRTCKPIREFGGWGLRYGARGLTAYTTSGKHGLEIHTKKGKKIFLGTQKPSEMADCLRDLGKEYLIHLVE